MQDRRTLRWIRAVGVVAVVVALPVAWQVLSERVASADTVPVAVVFDDLTESDSESKKKSVALCPPGKRVLGGGARENGAQHVVLTRQEPVHDPSTRDSYVVEASEDQTGFAGAWALQAYAICADPPPGLEIVSKTVPAPSGAFHHQVTAICPAGKFAVGAGGRIEGGQGQVDLSTLALGGFANRTTAAGTTDLDGFASSWSVTAFAVCVKPNDLFDLHVVREQAISDPPDTRISLDAWCPSGKKVTGGAAFANTPGVIESVVPGPGANRLRIRAIARDNSPTPGTLGVGLTVVAFCAS